MPHQIVPHQMVKRARLAGTGWLVLIGGGELSFGETEEVDQAWLARLPPGPVAFVPTASGSEDYGRYFAAYLREAFDRDVEVVPIYRPRDARRGKNSERLQSAAAVYLGGGLAEQLLDTLRGSPALDALAEKLRQGGTVVAITAAAQALGEVTRSLRRNEVLTGLGWLPGGVIETNFDPAHDRRLRQALRHPEARWGLGIAAGSSIALGPQGEVEVVGTVFGLDQADGELRLIEGT